jgi:membrane protein
MKPLRELLNTPTTQLGRAGRLLVFQIKLWPHCVRLLDRNRAGQQAAALSYYTIFGLVPLAIVVLLVFQLFPTYRDIGEKLRDFTYEQLHLTRIEYAPQSDQPEDKVLLTDYLNKIIQQFFSGLDKGSLSLVSAVVVIWAALALLATIERAFNRIWHVTRGRSFFHRMVNYWALLTLVPLLLGVGIYATTSYTMLRSIETTVLAHVAPTILSFLLALLVFFLLYFLLPNARVHAGAALWGAAIAALAWSVAKWGFGKYVTEFIPYSRVYGVLGLIPLTIFWIDVTWLIVLFGLQLTFTTQNLQTLEAAQIAAARKAEQEYFIANDLTAINMAREIAEVFERGEGPITAETLCSRLEVPPELGERLLNNLVARGLLARTQEPGPGLVPARSPETIRLSDIAQAVAEAAFGQPKLHDHTSLGRIVLAQRHSLSEHSLREICEIQQTSSDTPSEIPDDKPQE